MTIEQFETYVAGLDVNKINLQIEVLCLTVYKHCFLIQITKGNARRQMTFSYRDISDLFIVNHRINGDLQDATWAKRSVQRPRTLCTMNNYSRT
jgi:hypothetical protein